jgi:hypothetical protein
MEAKSSTFRGTVIEAYDSTRRKAFCFDDFAPAEPGHLWQNSSFIS